MRPEELLRNAIVAVEDRRFYSHWGVDPIAILRCIVVNSRSGRYAQGGSTITQQLARTLYLTPKKTLARKLKEILIAIKLELTHTKEEILRLYIHNVYMGHRENGTELRGFRDASIHFFKKTLRNLTPAEIAWLVGMLKGPNIYHPRTEKGRVRQTYVLSVLADRGMISVDEMQNALKEL